MSTIIKRIIAIANLGVYFFMHLARLAFNGILRRKQPDPVETFVQQFADDNLYHLPEDQVEHILDMQHCMGCGLCRLSGGDAAALPQRELRDLSLPLDAATAQDADTVGLNGLCPAGVPLEQLRDMVKTYGE